MTISTIRMGLESDLPNILDLIRAKAVFDGCLDSLRADEQALRLALFSAFPKAKVLVSEVNGKVVGLATYYDIYSSFLAKPGIWLDDIFVYEEYRGLGIGKALMDGICCIAHGAGCARVDWIVARDNDNARAFYTKIGAEISELVRHARLNEDAIHRAAVNAA